MIRMFWWRAQPNFGDELSPAICAELAGRPVEFTADLHSCDLIALGSLLEIASLFWRRPGVGRWLTRTDPARRPRPERPFLASLPRWLAPLLAGGINRLLAMAGDCDFGGALWGPGFLHGSYRAASYPRASVHALRGDLTRRRLGLESDVALGDPALLCDRLARPRPKRFKLGLAPHMAELVHPLMREIEQRSSEITLIDVREGVRPVLDRIAECEYLVGSALHPLVVADALEIPNAWTELSGLLPGGHFKYRDYYSVFGLRDVRPLELAATDGLDSILPRLADYKRPGLERIKARLAKTFPFGR